MRQISERDQKIGYSTPVGSLYRISNLCRLALLSSYEVGLSGKVVVSRPPSSCHIEVLLTHNIHIYDSYGSHHSWRREHILILVWHKSCLEELMSRLAIPLWDISGLEIYPFMFYSIAIIWLCGDKCAFNQCVRTRTRDTFGCFERWFW